MKRRTKKDLESIVGPQRAAAANAGAEAKARAFLLAELRRQLGLTQRDVAKAMGVSQSALSQIESQSDMQLSTLRRLIEALGGQLDVTVRFGNRSMTLSQAKVLKRRSA